MTILEVWSAVIYTGDHEPQSSVVWGKKKSDSNKAGLAVQGSSRT